MAAAVAQERLVEVKVDESVVADRRPAGEEKAFRSYDPDQVLLMAPVLQELGTTTCTGPGATA